ncbi:MAG: single-stranded DNA-binding protein [Chromatiaceae bacterium]|nr:single-stranded DNA-binding protein [Chromatiaceae bacterium]
MASRGVNKAIIIGHLGADPDLRQTQSGVAVCTLSVATSESWTDKHTGEAQERTEWHRVVLWQKVAEIAAQYLRKGSRAYFEGQLKTRKWEDQNGTERYSTEIHAQQMQMLDGKPSDDRGQARAQQQPAPRQQDAFQAPTDFDDDIPF